MHHEKAHVEKMLKSYEDKMKMSSERSLSLLRQKAEKSSNHLILVERRKKEHEEQLHKERLETLEKSIKKHQQNQEFKEFRDASLQNLQNMKRMKFEERMDSVRNNIKDLKREEKIKNIEILKKHGKKIQLKKPTSISTVERHNNFLKSKKKVERQAQKWKNKIMDKHIKIYEKVDEIKYKKDQAIKIVQDLEILNKYTSK